MVERFNSYVPNAGYLVPTADTSFGTNSNQLPVAPDSRVYSKTSSATASLSTDLVTIGGVQTTREAAINAGLMDSGNAFTPAAAEAHTAITKAAAPVEREQSREAAIYDAHDRTMDAMEAQFDSREQITGFVEAVIAGEEEAVDAVPAAIVEGKTLWASKIAESVGLPNLAAMTTALSEEDRQEALRAVITGNETAFTKYVSQTIKNAAELAHDPDFHAELAEAGVQVVGTDIIVNGGRISIRDAILRGIIRED